MTAATFSFAHDYILGFIVGWGACTLFFTAIFAFRSHWLAHKEETP